MPRSIVPARIRSLFGASRLLVLAVTFLVACGGTRGESALSPFGPNDTPEATSEPGDPLSFAIAPPDPVKITPNSVAARALSSFPVFTDPGELPSLVVAKPGVAPSERRRFPLTNTNVSARLGGFAAEVEVTQRFENAETTPIEAVYVFPLPENAAVSAMRMKVAGRTIEARIDERGSAKRTYDRAKELGLSAALLEQERPNVFTQSVANIPPGEAIEVTTRYVQDLSYDAGVYEFVFPMVVGPRFVQGSETGGAPSGTGTKADTDAIPDASRISPPYMGKGERSGHDIAIEVVAESGLAIGDYAAITHTVEARRDDEGLVHLALSKSDKVPNRDFVLRYRVAGERPRAIAQLAGKNAPSGFFSLTVDPPDVDVDDLVGRREIVFVVDISGSMAGAPLGLCKEAMRGSLSKLRPHDTFNIITFSGATEKLFPRARPANNVSINEGLAFVDRMKAGGGTRLLDAVASSLSSDVAEGRGRFVFFMTDGYVAEQDQILSSTRSFVAAMEGKGQRARVFGFGVGSSPNRALLDGLAREGKGLTVYATNREHPRRAVNQFYRYIDRSILRDVSIDWGGMEVADVLPTELPDLFASHPLTIHGRFRGRPSRPPVVHATSAAGPIEIPVTIVAAPATPGRDFSGILWARAKVTELDGDLAAGDPRAQGEITRLGIDFSLVTRFTSFVAVDSSRQVGDGAPKRVVQPSERPEGVDLESAGGKEVRTPTGTPPEPKDSKPDGGDRGEMAKLDPNITTRPAQPTAIMPDRDSDGVMDEADSPSAGASPPPAAERGRGSCFCGAAPGADLGGGLGGTLAVVIGMALLAVRTRRRR